MQPDQRFGLDRGLANLAARVEKLLGRDIAGVPGSGAAGGLGAAVMAFLNGELASGAQLILDVAGFDALLSDTALVITGEGRIDGQSGYGKVVGAVAARCKAREVPCLALCGSIGPGAEVLYQQGGKRLCRCYGWQFLVSFFRRDIL